MPKIHSRTSSLGSQSTISLASAEVQSYFEGQNEDSTQSYSGTQDLNPPQQTQFFDPSSFSSQTVPSSSRRGRGRYPR
ncbi:hypothetical protein AC249_AIPGENE28362 [Exaiptasia diaphana]|nr:hypothetical protein AC249_AIPGENE28362 [Exaiptasia diaphana]